MATQVQLRRGTATENNSFTGAVGEVTCDTTNDTMRVHDGSTAGGFETARADINNVTASSITTKISGSTVANLTISTADINAGTIDNVTIGGSTPGAGSFSGMTVSGDLTIDTSTLKVDSANNRVGILETSPTVPLEVKGAQAYASSASNLETSTTKATARIRGSSDATTSLFFGSLTNDAQQYIQSANGAGSAADDLALNPFGGNVGIGTTSPVRQLHVNAASGSNAYLHLTNATTGTTTGDGLSVLVTNSTGQAIINQREAQPLAFYTSGSERARILAGGGLTFNGDTATANALNDYEEGTWTPTFEAGSASVANALYIKIGRFVQVAAVISAFTDRTSSANLDISGLPYASASDNKTSQSIMCRFINAGGDSVAAYIANSVSKIQFYGISQGAGYAKVNHNELNNSTANLFITCTYRAA